MDGTQTLDKAPLASSPGVHEAWEILLESGWTIVADDRTEFGFDPLFRQHLTTNYFSAPDVLQTETYDVFPPNRKRARGLVNIAFDALGVTIPPSDHPPSALEGTEYHKGKRYYPHLQLTKDPSFCHWITQLANIVPPPTALIPNLPLNYEGVFDPSLLFGHPCYEPLNRHFLTELEYGDEASELRRYSSTASARVGINLFETYDSVVSSPHRDETDWVVVYVVDKSGCGAISELYRPGSNLPHVARELQPGQMIIFNDKRFLHSTTPLTPSDKDTTYRDTVVCTFDFERSETEKKTEKR